MNERIEFVPPFLLSKWAVHKNHTHTAMAADTVVALAVAGGLLGVLAILVLCFCLFTGSLDPMPLVRAQTHVGSRHRPTLSCVPAAPALSSNTGGELS